MRWTWHDIVGALSEKRIIKIFIISLQSVSCRVVLFGQKRKKENEKKNTIYYLCKFDLFSSNSNLSVQP